MVQHLPSLPEDLGLISSTTKSPARRTDCGTIVILPRSWNYILPPLGTASYNHVPGAVTLDKSLQVEICTTGTLTNAALVCDGGQLTKLETFIFGNQDMPLTGRVFLIGKMFWGD